MTHDLQASLTFNAALNGQHSIGGANTPRAATSSSSNRQEKFNQLTNDEYE
jgi:hypothetical protein